ncbi:hypothetical protein [Paenibacillus polymyxa]|uniref:hypothetical protein n=1 Tax=Paenibacillus polymyxa TaxID=1406 RepID=UPI00037040EA|nr:hypothetical protein [Paenibacillus polymyxa]NMP11406.1 hypothetical protein [Paenibacillus polymyxa]PNQ84241.1 hypothetical protein C1T20_20025 [Paenibacillus polymyxa]
MYTNNSEERKFLYAKPYFAGVIVDTDSNGFDWFGNDERGQLEIIIKESNFDDLICELVHIFKEGLPNYYELSSLFSMSYEIVQGYLISRYGLETARKEKEEFERRFGKGKAGMDNGDKIICRVKNVERKDQDISKIEMDIDIESLKINDLYLFVNEIPDLNELKTIIGTKFDDIDIAVGNKLIVKDKTYRIIILEDENKMND